MRRVVIVATIAALTATLVVGPASSPGLAASKDGPRTVLDPYAGAPADAFVYVTLVTYVRSVEDAERAEAEAIMLAITEMVEAERVMAEAQAALDRQAARVSSETTASEGGGAGGLLAQIRACESGDNYTIVSSSGLYYGAYQFLPSTWDSTAARAGRDDLVGVLPSNASPADQDAMAAALLSSSGSSPWPVCGR